jgi:hypothetical protein
MRDQVSPSRAALADQSRKEGKPDAVGSGSGVIIVDSDDGSRRQKRPVFMQHFLKGFVGAARTWIIATKSLFKKLVAVYDANASLDVSFGGETPAALAHWQVKSSPFRTCFLPWYTSLSAVPSR